MNCQSIIEMCFQTFKSLVTKIFNEAGCLRFYAKMASFGFEIHQIILPNSNPWHLFKKKGILGLKSGGYSNS